MVHAENAAKDMVDRLLSAQEEARRSRELERERMWWEQKREEKEAKRDEKEARGTEVNG